MTRLTLAATSAILVSASYALMLGHDLIFSLPFKAMRTAPDYAHFAFYGGVTCALVAAAVSTVLAIRWSPLFAPLIAWASTPTLTLAFFLARFGGGTEDTFALDFSSATARSDFLARVGFSGIVLLFPTLLLCGVLLALTRRAPH